MSRFLKPRPHAGYRAITASQRLPDPFPTPALATIDLCFGPCHFAFSRLSHKWNHTPFVTGFFQFFKYILNYKINATRMLKARQRFRFSCCIKNEIKVIKLLFRPGGKARLWRSHGGTETEGNLLCVPSRRPEGDDGTHSD